MREDNGIGGDNPKATEATEIPLKAFVLKRVEALLQAGQLELAFRLVHSLDPLPSPFDRVLAELDLSKLYQRPYFDRRTMSIRLCLKTIRRGYFSTW
jgi:hypothetical protein